MKEVLVLMFSVIILAGCEMPDAHSESMDILGDFEGAFPQIGHAFIELPTVQCGACERIIKNGLFRTPGILSIHIDLDNKNAHINYDVERINLAEIELAISEVGYHANQTPADSLAYKRIPECCKVKT